MRSRSWASPRFRRVRETFEAAFARGDELGAAVSVTLDGEPVVDLWGGWADSERRQPWQAGTLVNVYSTTKGMTAICALRLVDAYQPMTWQQHSYRDWLRDTLDRTMLAAGGYADTRAVESKDTDSGKAANRRIEIVLYPKDLTDLAGTIK